MDGGLTILSTALLLSAFGGFLVLLFIRRTAVGLALAGIGAFLLACISLLSITGSISLPRLGDAVMLALAASFFIAALLAARSVARRPIPPPGGDAASPTGDALRRLFDGTFEGIVLTEGGVIVECNTQFTAMLGYRGDDLLGKPLSLVIRPESHQIESAQTGTGEGVAYEQRARMKDNTVFPVEVRSRSLSVGGRQLTLSAIRDMTERKKTEERLRVSEESFRELTESITDVFFAMDHDFTVTHWNKASEYMTGVTARDAVGKSLFEIFPELLGTRAEELLQQVVQTRSPQSFVSEQAPGGGKGIVEIRTYPTRRGLAVFLEDISERVHSESRLKASLQEKEALLKEIHHRVKNNLQIISSLLSLQSDQLESDGALDALRDSQSRVRSMAMIHEQLYSSGDLGRIDFGQYLADLTAQLFRTYSFQAQTIDLALDLSPVTLQIDKAIPCGMIANELVTNCLKHAFAGRTRGRVQVRLSALDDGRVRFGVHDDGVGVPADRDLDSSPSLGMKLVRTLTDQLHGTLSIERGSGTGFTIEFPGA